MVFDGRLLDSIEMDGTASREPKTVAQIKALNSEAEILLFGGAAGSLKSETLLIDAAREAENPNLNAIIFRESHPQLADLVRKSRRLFRGRPYWGRYGATEHVWLFPRNLREMREVARANDERYAKSLTLLPMPQPVNDEGASLRFGYLRNDEDCEAHDGQEYSFIGFDESTHHTEYQIRYLFSRLRSTDTTLLCRMRLASNPGNIGHVWHKHVFIGDECPHCKPNSERVRKPFTLYCDATFTDGTPVKHSTEFIPGRVTDHNLFADPRNPAAGNEPYIRRLELQRPELAKRLREGCWAVVEGQFFLWDETRGQAMPKDDCGPDLRMVIPFAEAPVEWWHHHFTGTDWGVGTSQAATVLCVRTQPVDGFPNGRIFALKELCSPHSNVRDYSQDFLNQLVRPDFDGERRKIVASYLGPDSWADRGDGHTIAGQLEGFVSEYGISFRRASTDRVGGWQLIYRMLKSGELVICGDTCPQLVKAIPSRLHDPKRPGDIIKRPGDPYDDVIDALRYAIYSFIDGSDVQKPFPLRVAESMNGLDPTMRILQMGKILEAALSEEGEQPTFYSKRAHLRFLMRNRQYRRRK